MTREKSTYTGYRVGEVIHLCGATGLYVGTTDRGVDWICWYRLGESARDWERRFQGMARRFKTGLAAAKPE
jgi:hypothetical protein